METNKKYPEKEPITKSDILLIVIWVIVGLAFSIWPAVLSITKVIWNSSEIESELSNFIGASLEYNGNVNKSEISLDQKDWFYRYQWSYYWWSESYKYEFNYFNPESEDIYYTEEDNERLLLSTKEYKRIKDLYEFKDSIYFNFKFEDWKIKEQKIYNKINNKDFGDLSIEDIKKELNPELKYQTKEIDINTNKNLRISEYEENIIYKFSVPKWQNGDIIIENNTEDEILLYKKETDWYRKWSYQVTIIEPDSKHWLVWYTYYDETVRFYFKKATLEEKLNYWNIKKISNQELNKKIEAWWEDQYYNDTDNDIYVTTIDEKFDEEDEVEIKNVIAWEFFEIPDFTDYIYITDHEPKPEEFLRYKNPDKNEEHYVKEDQALTSWTIEKLQK